MGKLAGKVIVVTGASRGLGETMAVAYAHEGADLVLAARTPADLERVSDRCRAAGATSVLTIRTDVTEESQVQRLVDETLEAHGSVDVFVANAGASYFHMTDKRYTNLASYDLDIVEKLFRLNAIGTWLCMKAALPVMKPGSSFVNVGSSTGRALYPGSGFYAITKATGDAMAQLAAKEFGPEGVRVNTLCPGGMVDTHLFGPDKMPEHLKERALPDDVMVPAAIWLASDDSADVNGAFITGRDFNDRGVAQIKAELVTSPT